MPDTPAPQRVVRRIHVARISMRCGFCGTRIPADRALYLVEEVGGRPKVWAGECCAGDL